MRMQFKALYPGIRLPEYGSAGAAAFDMFMPEDGSAGANAVIYGLGFAAAVPDGYVAMILPRSGVGVNYGVDLNNTAGIVDSDFCGEWRVSVRTKDGRLHKWKRGDRLFQCLVLPVARVVPEWADDLPPTERGAGGMGSTGV